jgi:hypothetical protein
MPNKSYNNFINSLVDDYTKLYGTPPRGEKDLDRFSKKVLAYHGKMNKTAFAQFIEGDPFNDFSNIKIIDKDGATITVKSKGAGIAKEQARVIKINRKFDKDEKDRKKYAVAMVLRNDIKEACKRVNRKIYRKELPVADFLYKPQPKPQGAGSFEREFKGLITAGKSLDVLFTAKMVINRMSQSDKIDLDKSLKGKGVNTVQDLEGLLNQWKGEVLGQGKNPQMTRARPKIKRTITFTPGY